MQFFSCTPDDTIVFFSAPKLSVIQATLVKELQAIECWLHSNTLLINITKAEAMLFGTSQKLATINQFSVTINRSAIKRVTKFKYLGVVLTNISAKTGMLRLLFLRLVGGSVC